MTEDGLHRLEHARFDDVYVRPDIDLRGYDQLLIGDVELTYREHPRPHRRYVSSQQQAFLLSDDSLESLRTLSRDTVVEELSQGDGWKIVDAPAPNALRLDIALTDMVVNVPEQMLTGPANSVRVFVKRSGAATLVVELHDSQSGTLLARFSERGEVKIGAEIVYESTAPTNREYTRVLLVRWARTLHRSLDELRATTL